MGDIMELRDIKDKLCMIKKPLNMIRNLFNNRADKELDYDKALKYMRRKHRKQTRVGTDKKGNPIPYSKHPEKVAKIIREKGFGMEYIITALFHDLKEDTNATRRKIIKLSNERVYEAVVLLTKPPKPKNYKTDLEVRRKYMNEYFGKIKNNHIAHMVKLADRIHNLKESFMQDEKFIRKYIVETEEYFIDLAKGTVFEEDLNHRLNALKEFCEEKFGGVA